MRAALVAIVFLVAATPAAARTSPAARALFKARCGKCHTLLDAKTTGKTGPVLTKRHEPVGKVLTLLANGGDTMPSFLTSLTSAQMQQLATYVAAASK